MSVAFLVLVYSCVEKRSFVFLLLEHREPQGRGKKGASKTENERRERMRVEEGGGGERRRR